jgi:hypothetical protein
MGKAIYPGMGWFLCWGQWGRCEAEAKWRQARWALCDDCYKALHYYPDGKRRHTALPEHFIRQRFWLYNPDSARRKLEAKAEALARALKLTPIKKWLGPLPG